MRRTFLALALMIGFHPAGWAGTSLSVQAFRQQINQANIHFENFKSTNRWNSQHHPLILDTPSKRNMQGILTTAAKGSPNFDGKYVVAVWGGGSGAQVFAIIDLETGIVKEGKTTSFGVAMRLNSSLLILNDPEVFLSIDWPGGMLPSYLSTQFMRWNGKDLITLKSINP